MLQETFKTRYYEMSPDGTLPAWVLQNYFQESAAVDAHNLSFGWEELSANGVAWILTKVQMQLLKPVSGAQKITVKTWHCYSDKIQSRRDFIMFNQQGEHIAKRRKLVAYYGFKQTQNYPQPPSPYRFQR